MQIESRSSSPALREAVLTKLERRAKRQARREKQRADNVQRARKMHVARVASSNGGVPTVEDEERSSSNLRIPELHIGCSGWFYWHWRTTFYPSDLPTKKWFDHYASRFTTVELNAPFYSWPTVGTVESWKRQAGRRRFVYTVKVCELITHIKRFTGTKVLIQDFGHIADILGPRMGCFLFQLPPSFHYTAARLKRILRQLDPNRRNVVEFRHSSWWIDEVFRAFRESGVLFCSCSAPRLPEQLVKTADDVYIRFHGTKQWYRHNYSKAELASWTERILACGAKRVWVYFNNDREAYAISNARSLLRGLQRKPCRRKAEFSASKRAQKKGGKLKD
jgi:uncharacterized protein YecE (DUF72 family)